MSVEPMDIGVARKIAAQNVEERDGCLCGHGCVPCRVSVIAAAGLAVELAAKCRRHEAIMNSQSTQLGEWERETGCTSPADANARIQDLASMATEARARTDDLEARLNRHKGALQGAANQINHLEAALEAKRRHIVELRETIARIQRERLDTERPTAPDAPVQTEPSEQDVQDSESEIAPCPSCGSEDVGELGVSQLGAWVVCKNHRCKLSGPLGDDLEDAIHKWNRLSLGDWSARPGTETAAEDERQAIADWLQSYIGGDPGRHLAALVRGGIHVRSAEVRDG